MDFMHSKLSSYSIKHGIKVILALALIASLAVPMVFGVVLAQVPPGCTGNNFFVDLEKDKIAVHQGELLKYTVDVGNEDGTGCNIEDATITFTQPAANGTATGTSAILETGVDFPRDGTNNTTYLPGSYAILNYTVAVNPGVTAITAEAVGDGTLMDSPGGSAALVSKTVTATVLSPDIEVTKTVVPDLSKAGDIVTYTITVENTGDVDLDKTSIIDTLLGDITADFAATLAVGNSESHSYPYTVKVGDPDPLENTVTATYEDYTGWAVSDIASASVDLVHPDLLLTKTGDELSKPGDEVTYEFYIENTGDHTLNRDSVTDTLLGDITADFPATLIPGASATIYETRTVLAGDPDPLENTVTAIYVVDDLGNVIERTASHSVDLVAPDLVITKTGDELSKAGDEVTYEFYIENTGDCTLNRQSVTDTVLGDITANFPATLAAGASETIYKTRTVLAGDPDPLDNTVTATYVVPVLGNIIERTASHSVDLLHPDLVLTKTGDELSKAGDEISYEFYIENTGDCTLNRQSVTDTVLGDITANFPATLVPGASATVTKTYTVKASDPDPLVNTVTAIYVVAEVGNEIERTAGPHSVDLVHPDLDLDKEAHLPGGATCASVGDEITYEFYIENTGDCTLDRQSVTDTVLGNLTADFPATLAAGASATVTKTYTVQDGDLPLRNCVTAVYVVPVLGNEIERTDCEVVEPCGVPTLTQWGIIGMAALFLAGLVVLGVRQRRRVSSTTH